MIQIVGQLRGILQGVWDKADQLVPVVVRDVGAKVVVGKDVVAQLRSWNSEGP